MKDTLSFLVQQLLKANKITIDFDELEFQIQSHPTYPSLHAITGVLDYFNIENLVLDIPKNIETLNQLPNTYIAQIENNDQKQFAVVSTLKDSYKLVFSDKEKKSLSKSEFSKQFTGILLAVEKNESTIKPKNSTINPYIIKGLTFSSAIIFGILFSFSNFNLENLSFLLLSALGIYFSITILKQEHGESTILGNAFCSNSTEKKNCNAVLSSKAANIYKTLKLSDLSLTYFTSLTLATFLLTISNNTIYLTKFISVLVLPITIYSIYYQTVIIKKWCFLCLSIVAVLCCQASLALAFFQPIYNIETILIVVLSFSFINTFWLYQSRVLDDNRVLKSMKTEYYKFKRNFELFNSLLNKSEVINTQIKSLEEIVFGNVNSNLNITVITNPLCGHCKPVHKLIEQILNNNSQSTRLIIRFNVNLKNLESLTVKIASRLLEIYHVNGAKICLKAMHEIYGDSSPEEWFKKWEYCNEPQVYIPILKKEHSWCQKNSINFTPEILINGRFYPKIFNRNDLIYFLEDLEQHSQFNNNNTDPLLVNEI